MSYKNILNIQMGQYNDVYKKVCKLYPSYSLNTKEGLALNVMCHARGFEDLSSILLGSINPTTAQYQYIYEVVAVLIDIDFGIDRYYLKDDSLFDFFRDTEVRQKEVQSILDTLETKENGTFWGVIGQNYSCTILYTKIPDGRHFITVFDDDLNQTFCVEECTEKLAAYNLALNFLFYINAFPECVVDGVPNGVKKNPKAKSINVSDKVVSHTSVEHGFVRPHFRSGYFRHFNSDWYVNCKGQVRFIASTMVKGKAKTLISKEER